MTSAHFVRLETAVYELKRIYLDAALADPAPSPDHQELARAFVAFAHAEFEHFVEEALRELANVALSQAASGHFGKASLALLTFTGLDGMNGGVSLSRKKGKTPRQLSTRVGAAHAKLVGILDANNGVREKHLAAMAIPLGLDVSAVDNTWLNDLDAFCSSRGAFVHLSRATQRSSHLAVNPHDVWAKCKRLVWIDPALGQQGMVASFESFDLWIETEKNSFGPAVSVPAWRLSVLKFLAGIFADRRAFRRLASQEDE